jgi:hypothetical protein
MPMIDNPAIQGSSARVASGRIGSEKRTKP